MTSETDEQFVERIESRWMIAAPEADIIRLFALARRGAAVQWRPISEDTPEIENVLFCGVEKVCEGWRAKDRFYAADDERIDNVRYWMPLPPPPSGEPRDE